MAKKTKVESLLSSPVEAKANKWALYGLAALLLMVLASWGGREYQLSLQIHQASQKAVQSATELSQVSARLSDATHAQQSLAEQLQIARSTHSRKQGGSTIKRPDGSEESTWLDEEASSQEEATMAKQQVEELTRNLIASRDEVDHLNTIIDELNQEASSSKVELLKRTHNPFSVAMGATTDKTPYLGAGFTQALLGVEVSAEATAVMPCLSVLWGGPDRSQPSYTMGIRIRP